MLSEHGRRMELRVKSQSIMPQNKTFSTIVTTIFFRFISIMFLKTAAKILNFPTQDTAIVQSLTQKPTIPSQI